MSNAEKAILMLQSDLENTEARARDLRVAIETIRRLVSRDKTAGTPDRGTSMLLAQGPVDALVADRLRINGKPANRVAKTAAPATRKSKSQLPAVKKRKPGRGKSKFPGVSTMPPGTRKPGLIRWRAQSSKGGKYKYYGTFAGPDAELLAAAAYQEKAVGDKAYAAELRQRAADLMEQLENNPDRRRRKTPGSKVAPELPPPSAFTYECNRCGRDYLDKPDICPGCKGKSFARINPDGSGPSDLQESPDE